MITTLKTQYMILVQKSPNTTRVRAFLRLYTLIDCKRIKQSYFLKMIFLDMCMYVIRNMSNEATKPNMTTPEATETKCLGSGAYGQVTSNEKGMAIKTQPFDYGAMKEYAFVKMLPDNPNIIKFDDDIVYRHNKVSFSMPKGLKDLGASTNLAPKRVTKIIHGVLRGLEFLHSHGVLHRDIKPANVLLFPNDEVKIIDFGLSTLLNKGHVEGCTHSDAIQTLDFRAPEVVQHKPHSRALDMWSVGALILYLLQCDTEYCDMLNGYIEQVGTICEEEDWNKEVHDSMFVHRFFSYMIGPPNDEIKMYSEETKLFKKKWIRNKGAECIKIMRVHAKHPLLDLAFKLLDWNPETRWNARQALKHPAFKKLRLCKFTRIPLFNNEWKWDKDVMDDQKDVNLRMRTILFEWLWESMTWLGYSYPILIASFRLVDEMLKIEQIQRKNFQLVGSAAAYLVINLYCTKPSDASDWVFNADKAFTVKELDLMTVSFLTKMDVYGLTRRIVCLKPLGDEIEQEKRWKALTYEVAMMDTASRSFTTSKILKGNFKNLGRYFIMTIPRRNSKYLDQLVPEYYHS